MYAVIQTGGKQVRVSEGIVIEVEKRPDIQPGDGVTFSDVLLLADGENLSLGAPRVEKANVFGTVLDVLRSSKILIFKKKRRKQYRRLRGHRQYLMRVRIDEIGLHSERRKQPEPMKPAAGQSSPATAKAARVPAVKKSTTPAAKRAGTAKVPPAGGKKPRVASAGKTSKSKSQPKKTGKSAGSKPVKKR